MTGTCRGHYASAAIRRSEPVAICRRVHKAGTTCSLREEKESPAIADAALSTLADV